MSRIYENLSESEHCCIDARGMVDIVCVSGREQQTNAKGNQNDRSNRKKRCSIRSKASEWKTIHCWQVYRGG